MSQGTVRLRYGEELFEGKVDAWDNPDNGASYEIHFSGLEDDGWFLGSCKLQRVANGWKYTGTGLWQYRDKDEVYPSTLRVQLHLEGKLLVLEGQWQYLDEDEPYQLHIVLENR